MTREVPLYDAKNGLSALIAELETIGGSVIITRHGKPVARLSAVVEEDRGAARTAVAKALIDRLEHDDASVRGPDLQELKEEMDKDRP